MVPSCTKPLIYLLNEEKMLLNEDTDNLILIHIMAIKNKNRAITRTINHIIIKNTERSTDHDLIYWI